MTFDFGFREFIVKNTNQEIEQVYQNIVSGSFKINYYKYYREEILYNLNCSNKCTIIVIKQNHKVKFENETEKSHL